MAREIVERNDDYCLTVDTHYIVWSVNPKKAICEFNDPKEAQEYFKHKSKGPTNAL